MKFKSDVSIKSFTNPKVMKILQAVQDTAPEGYEPTVTSASDGIHMSTSKHYTDEAFDIRVRDYPGYDQDEFWHTRQNIDNWITRMRFYLTSMEYDIVFGDEEHRDHIHIEYDNK